jgi:hypothetical protein
LFSPAVQDGTDSARSVAILEGQGLQFRFRIADDLKLMVISPLSVLIAFSVWARPNDRIGLFSSVGNA